MKTRAKKLRTATTHPREDTVKTSVDSLDASITNPPRVFILPKESSPNARFITVKRQNLTCHNEIPVRYLACPNKGFYEINRIAAPKKACRSWLLTPGEESLLPESKPPTHCSENQEATEDEEGYILANPDLYVATPVDPLFVMLSLEGILWQSHTSKATEYLALSDRIRALKLRVPHLRQLLEDNPGSEMERLLESRTKVVCDELSLGDDEAMYAFSVTRLAQVLLKKALHMVKVGLPASMEERFIKQTLETPVLSICREDSTVSTIAANEAADHENDLHTTSTSHAMETATTSAICDSTQATSIDQSQEKPLQDVYHLLRIRTALKYITTSYIPVALHSQLEKMYHSSGLCSIDFGPLDKHLAHIASLKTQAQALRSISDNVSRKRAYVDDEEALEKLEVKKHKKEEEEARKKNVSHGVKKLMKANTSGMQKLSSFFTKGAIAKTKS